MANVNVKVILTILAGTFALAMLFYRRKIDFKGKRCYITGGSQGLGLALAEKLVAQGAHVVIVARNLAKLEAAETLLKSKRQDESQVVKAVSADLTSRQASADAINTAVEAFKGAIPEHVYLCAGFAEPGFFVTATEEDLRAGLDGVYWVSAWTAQIAARLMAQHKATGSKIIFVSSFLSLVSFVGYSAYAPGKFALRGLAETLRSELQLYGIDVHVYCPAGILSPHYYVEQTFKPEITKKIEEGDTPISPEASAGLLLKGLDNGYYTFTNDLITDIMRVGTGLTIPGNNVIWDSLLRIVAMIGIPIWRKMTDSKIKAHRQEHEQKLKAEGFFDQ